MDDVPNEVLIHICTYLDITDIVRWARTARNYRLVLLSDVSIWRPYYLTYVTAPRPEQLTLGGAQCYNQLNLFHHWVQIKAYALALTHIINYNLDHLYSTKLLLLATFNCAEHSQVQPQEYAAQLIIDACLHNNVHMVRRMLSPEPEYTILCQHSSLYYYLDEILKTEQLLPVDIIRVLVNMLIDIDDDAAAEYGILLQQQAMVTKNVIISSALQLPFKYINKAIEFDRLQIYAYFFKEPTIKDYLDLRNIRSSCPQIEEYIRSFLPTIPDLTTLCTYLDNIDLSQQPEKQVQLLSTLITTDLAKEFIYDRKLCRWCLDAYLVLAMLILTKVDVEQCAAVEEWNRLIPRVVLECGAAHMRIMSKSPWKLYGMYDACLRRNSNHEG